jgi:hypothetical protein
MFSMFMNVPNVSLTGYAVLQLTIQGGIGVFGSLIINVSTHAKSAEQQADLAVFWIYTSNLSPSQYAFGSHRHGLQASHHELV